MKREPPLCTEWGFFVGFILYLSLYLSVIVTAERSVLLYIKKVSGGLDECFIEVYHAIVVGV